MLAFCFCAWREAFKSYISYLFTMHIVSVFFILCYIMYCAVAVCTWIILYNTKSATNSVIYHRRTCLFHHTPSYLCCLSQTIGDMIWQKTVPTPQRSLLWPVSWNCSEYCKALASQLLCNCEGGKKKKIDTLVWIYRKQYIQRNKEGVTRSTKLCGWWSLEILTQRRTKNVKPTSGKGKEKSIWKQLCVVDVKRRNCKGGCDSQ